MRTVQQGLHSFLNLFIVKSSSGSSVPYLDGIRAVAVIMIVIRHSWVLSGAPFILITMPITGNVVNLTPIFASTFTGVDLFFVLSGFLLAQTWLRPDFQGKPRPRTLKYFKQRFFRIAPAYYACLFLMLLFFTPKFISPDAIYSSQGAFVLGAHLVFMQYIFPVSSASYVINGSLWTLTMEVTFYILLPWLVYLFLKNRWLISLPIMLGIVMVWLFLAKHSLDPLVKFWVDDMARYQVGEPIIRFFISKQFPAHLADFGFGMALANLYMRYQTNYRNESWFRVITSRRAGEIYFIVGWFIVIYSLNKISSDPAPLFSYYLSEVAPAFGFTLVLAGLLFGGNWCKKLFSIVPLRFIGIIGYSIFLWHMPLINLFMSYPTIAALPSEQRFPAVMAATTVAALILCSGFYLAIEKPFMVLGRKQKTLPDTTTVQPLIPSETEQVSSRF